MTYSYSTRRTILKKLIASALARSSVEVRIASLKHSLPEVVLCLHLPERPSLIVQEKLILWLGQCAGKLLIGRVRITFENASTRRCESRGLIPKLDELHFTSTNEPDGTQNCKIGFGPISWFGILSEK